MIKRLRLFIYKEDCPKAGDNYKCEMMLIAANTIDEAMQLVCEKIPASIEYMEVLPNAYIYLCNPQILIL